MMHFSIAVVGSASLRLWQNHSMQILFPDFSQNEVLIRVSLDLREK
jgi:hypothetical protein